MWFSAKCFLFTRQEGQDAMKNKQTITYKMGWNTQKWDIFFKFFWSSQSIWTLPAVRPEPSSHFPLLGWKTQLAVPRDEPHLLAWLHTAPESKESCAFSSTLQVCLHSSAVSNLKWNVVTVISTYLHKVHAFWEGCKILKKPKECSKYRFCT